MSSLTFYPTSLTFIRLLEWPINKVQMFQKHFSSQKPVSQLKAKSIFVSMSGVPKPFPRIPLNQEDKQLSMINIIGILVQIQKFQMRSCGAQCQQKATFCPPSENTLHCPSQRKMQIISKCKLLNSHYNFLPKNSCNFICQEKAFAGDPFILLIIMS